MRALILAVDPAAGAAAAEALRARAGWDVTATPCPVDAIAATVRRTAAATHPDVALVVGGCGLGAHDTAPEQVTALCHGKMLYGLCEIGYQASGLAAYGLRRGVAGVAGSMIVACCPVENAGAAVGALAEVLPEFVAELRRTTPSTLPVPARPVRINIVAVGGGVAAAADAALQACRTDLQAAAATFGIATETIADTAVHTCENASWLRAHLGDVLKRRAAGGAAAAAAHYPDVAIIIGGDGLAASPENDTPTCIANACSGFTLPGLADVGYAAAGAAAAGLRCGVAGVCRHAGNALLVLNCPSVSTRAAIAALAPVLLEFLDHLRGDEKARGDEGGSPTTATTVPAAPKSVLTSVVTRARESRYLMMEMDEALRCIEALAPPPRPPVDVGIADRALVGMVTAKAVTAAIPHPPFPASIKDGYAIRAADAPGEFQVLPFAATAGGDASKVASAFASSSNAAGERVAVRVSTGGAVPAGADAVVQVEDTDLVEADAGRDVEKVVRIRVAARVGQDIRPVGSDIKEGTTLVPETVVVTPAEVGLAASGGYRQVSVYPRPKVAVLSSGDELRDAGAVDAASTIRFGEIYDSNRYALLAAIDAAGFTPVDLGVVKDTPDAIQGALRSGLAQADMVLSSGGVSMGEKDYLKPCIEAVGGTIHFGRVEMKPGKPTTFATVPGAGGAKVIFGLPGNPVSCLVCFHLFCVPALRKLAGYPLPQWHYPKVTATLHAPKNVKLDRERPEYHRAAVRFCPRARGFVAASTGGQISSRLLSMQAANGLLCLPKGTDANPEARPGEVYDCVLFGGL